jgi:hypothetical protein
MSRRRWYSRSVRVIAGATVIESPVCTPIGSRFSIEHTTTTLSARSRMTSSSYSFQPSMDSSTSTSVVGLRQPGGRRCVAARRGPGPMPEPAPPMVNEGAHHQGVAELLGGRQLASAIAADGGLRADLGAEAAATICLNSWRSSPSWIASMLAPISSTPYFSSTPALVQRDRGVEGGLPAQGGQQRVRAAPWR